MGCCRKNNKKIKNKNNITKTSKTNLLNDIKSKSIDEINQSYLPQESIENTIKIISSLKSPIISFPNYHIDDINSTDNISSVKILNDLQIYVQQNKKSVSILVFYAHYCPYSKRTIPNLRQWARENKDRIYLYEIDVEQASKLAEYYHIRTIPTIMAFEENNLLSPIWQRSANNVLLNEFDNSKNIYVILDSSLKTSDSIEIFNEIKQEQYLIILDKISNKTIENIISNENDQSDSIDNSRLKSLTSSQSPYIWNQSSDSQLMNDYNGRIISQSTISTVEKFKNKRTWDEYFNDNKQINEYEEYIHLPNSNEIFYKKQYKNFNYSLSSDRFSTLTYQYVKERNNLLIKQQEEDICILYFSPNRYRGFENNQISNPSKFSLLTLKSHLLSE